MPKKSKKVREVVEIITPVEEETMDVDMTEDMEASAADIENAADNDENGEVSEKVRKPRGKRQAYYDCAANVTLTADIPERNLKSGDKALILEPVAVTMPNDEGEFDRNKTRLEAIDIFKTKYGVEPELINGPIYNMKGTAAVPRKRETINVTVAKEARFTAEPRGNAIHRFKDLDWHVLVNFTEKPDTVFVFYDKLVDPKQVKEKDKAKFQKPTPKFIPITALRDLSRPGATA